MVTRTLLSVTFICILPLSFKLKSCLCFYTLPTFMIKILVFWDMTLYQCYMFIFRRCVISHIPRNDHENECTSGYGLSRKYRVRGKLQALLKTSVHKTRRFVHKTLPFPCTSQTLQSVVDPGFLYNAAPFFPVSDRCKPIKY